MKPKQKHSKMTAGQVVKDIRRVTRKQYSAEEKIRIVIDGLRGVVHHSHLQYFPAFDLTLLFNQFSAAFCT